MKVAVIGSGGAGMTAAWLLDGSHEVTLFERNATLGGHAHTTTIERDGRVHHADDGFGWFSDALYPKFMRLLELAEIPLRAVPISLSFRRHGFQRTLVMPPIGLFGLLEQLVKPSNLFDLIRLAQAISQAEPMVRERNKYVSWREFIERLPASFCHDILTPLVAAPLGGSCERVMDFSAYTVMKYYVVHRPQPLSAYYWRVIDNGASSYIQSVANTLKTCTIRTDTPVTAFIPCENGWTLQDHRGYRCDFDHVIVATGAPDAAKILNGSPGLESVCAVLNEFVYYPLRVLTHSDASFMPPRRKNWHHANISTNGKHAECTFWVDSLRESDVFVSYVESRDAKECHNISTFHVPLISPAHYRAQDKMEIFQGRDRISFAGDWTRDIGCHEDAVESAYLACQRIDAALPRLKLLDSPCQLPSVQSHRGLFAFSGKTPRPM